MLENIDTSLIDWSRAQFALTAIYHWIFVPLTLGLAVIMGIMETVYYRTGDKFWKHTAKFWMKLFGINFAIGVATGLILEFEFGTNWSNYSWFVGAACYRRYSGILYGSHVHCCDVLRLGQGKQTFPPGFYLAYGTWCYYLRLVDSGGECLDAESGRYGVQSRYSP